MPFHLDFSSFLVLDPYTMVRFWAQIEICRRKKSHWHNIGHFFYPWSVSCDLDDSFMWQTFQAIVDKSSEKECMCGMKVISTCCLTSFCKLLSLIIKHYPKYLPLLVMFLIFMNGHVGYLLRITFSTEWSPLWNRDDNKSNTFPLLILPTVFKGSSQSVPKYIVWNQFPFRFRKSSGGKKTGNLWPITATITTSQKKQSGCL